MAATRDDLLKQMREAAYAEDVASAAKQVGSSMDDVQRQDIIRAVQSPPLDKFGQRDIRREAALTVFSSKVQNVLDKRAEEDFLKLSAQNAHPPEVLREAMQYRVAYPELPFEYLITNLDKMRKRAQADAIPWDVIRERHPVLAKYVRNQETAGLALQDVALLQGFDRVTGGDVPGVAMKHPVTGKMIPQMRPTEAPWLKRLQDVFTKNVPYEAAMAGKVANEVFANMFIEGSPGEKFFASNAKVLEPHITRLSKEITSAKDYGPLPETGTKVGRGIEHGVNFVIETAPLLIAAALGGEAAAATRVGAGALKARTAGVALVNTIYSYPGLYERAKEASGGDKDIAFGVATAAAPVIGRIMGWNPVSNAAGASISRVVEEGVGRSALKAMESQSWRGLAWLTAKKGGFDFLVGQMAFGAQEAAMAASDNAAALLAGKDLRLEEIPLGFSRGVETGKDSWLLSLFGTTRSIKAEMGRMVNARRTGERLDKLVDIFDNLTPDEAGWQERMLREMGLQPGHDANVLLPLDKLQELAATKGHNPRELMGEVFGDGGATYDKHLAEGSTDIAIPIQKLKKIATSKLYGEFVRDFGRFDADGMARIEAAEIAKTFEKTLKEATKLDPEALDPLEKGIFSALKEFAKGDEQVAKEMFGYVKALHARMPELSVFEVYDATFRDGGLFGKQAEGPAVETEIVTPVERPGLKTSELVYRFAPDPHDGGSVVPLKLFLGNELVDGKPTWSVSGFDFVVPPAAYDYTKLVEQYGGKGYATTMYLAALKDAKNAGQGWISGEIRTDVTEKMYARLKKFGVPFTKHEGRWYISAEDLQKVDFKGMTNRGVESVDAMADRALRAAQREAAIGDIQKGIEELLKPEEAVAYQQVTQAARNESQAMFDAAVKAGVRQFIPQAREQAKIEVAKQMKDNPIYRAQHFLQTGELWGDQSRKPMMVHPVTGKTLLILEADAKRFGPEIVAALKEKKLLADKPENSVDVDALANALGFKSADGLVTGLRDALPEKEYVKRMTETRMQDLYRSDLLDNPEALIARAMDSVQNEKAAAKLFVELNALARQLDPSFKARTKLTKEQWKAFAAQILDNKALGEIHPQRFARAAARMSQQAAEALTEKRYNAAFNATEAAILNHYLYNAARERNDVMGRAFDQLARRSVKDSWRGPLGLADPTYRDLHDALLGSIGIMDPMEDTSKVLDNFLFQVEENGHLENLSAGKDWDVEVVAKVLNGERPWKELKPSEAVQVFKAIKNIQHIAKAQNAALATLQNSTKEALVGAARQALGGLAPGVQGPGVPPPNKILQEGSQASRDASAGASVTRWWDRRTALFGWGGAYVDAPRKILQHLGPEVREKIYGGYIKGRVTEDALLKTLYGGWKETQKIWENDPEYRTPLPGLDERLRMAGFEGELSKAYLVQVLKWIGSESGRKKILDGMGVNIQEVLDAAGTYLKPYELDAIQAEHDFFENNLWPLKAESHEKRTGLSLEKVRPMGYSITFTADGTTRHFTGGYYPVHWDTRPGVAQQQTVIDPDATGAGRRPKVPDGSFKERTKFVGVPDVEWSAIPHHLLSDIHNIAFGDFVQEAGQVLLDPRVLESMHRYMGEEYAAWPKAWLQRVATESASSVPSHLRALTKSMRFSRSALMTGALGLNLPVITGDFLHPWATAVMRDGVAATLTYTAPAYKDVMASAVSGLISGHDPAGDFAFNNSEILRLRADSLRENMHRWYGTFVGGQEPGLFKTMDTVTDAIQNASFWHMRQTDHLVSRIIWTAKYRKEMDIDANHDRAVKVADDQVLASMPNYNPMEIPTILADRNGAIAASMLVFQTYWLKLTEMAREGKVQMVDIPFQQAKYADGSIADARISAAMWAGRVMAMMTIAATMGDYVMGHGKQADEDWQTWFLRKELAAPFKLFPYASNVVEPIADRLVRGKGRDVYFTNPYFALAQRTTEAISKSLEARTTDEESISRLIEAALMMSGLPATSPVRAGRYVYRVAAGMEEPEGPIDFAGHVAYGKKYGYAARYQETNPADTLQNLFTE